MHQLLEHLLKITGPAVVNISSFSITEVALRSFHNLMESGQIMQLRCLFDMNVKRHKLGLLYFASNVVSSIGLDKCHAKIILIVNDNWKLVVISSANFNINDKKEAGIISTENHVYHSVLTVYNTWYENSMKISKHEFD
nr:hypothetical protein [Bacteroidota bacterium]